LWRAGRAATISSISKARCARGSSLVTVGVIHTAHRHDDRKSPVRENDTKLTRIEAEFATTFVSTPRGARLARRLPSERLDAWGFPYGSDINETLTLIVAERAANAVTHGRVPGRGFRPSLTLTATRDRARVEVTDTRDDRRPGRARPPTGGPAVRARGSGGGIGAVDCGR